jgi:hypothetical protein
MQKQWMTPDKGCEIAPIIARCSQEAVMENIDKRKETVAEDMLHGADEIAAFLGVSVAQVYHYARLKRLPIGKFGKNLIASRKQLQRAFNKLTTA